MKLKSVAVEMRIFLAIIKNFVHKVNVINVYPDMHYSSADSLC